MPGYKIHVFGGIVTFVVLYYITTFIIGIYWAPLWTIFFFGATILGSLIPDIDITSKIQRLFYFCIVGIFLFLLLTHQLQLLYYIAGLAIFVGLVRHRTIFHHPVFIPLIALPTIYNMSSKTASSSLIFISSLFFIAGFWSHLLLDFGFKNPRKNH
jgi:hypothetical protein